MDAIEVSLGAEGLFSDLVTLGVPVAIVSVCHLLCQELARVSFQVTVCVGIEKLVRGQLKVLGFQGGKVEGCGGRVPNAVGGRTKDLDAILTLKRSRYFDVGKGSGASCLHVPSIRDINGCGNVPAIGPWRTNGLSEQSFQLSGKR